MNRKNIYLLKTEQIWHGLLLIHLKHVANPNNKFSTLFILKINRNSQTPINDNPRRAAHGWMLKCEFQLKGLPCVSRQLKEPFEEFKRLWEDRKNKFRLYKIAINKFY